MINTTFSQEVFNILKATIKDTGIGWKITLISLKDDIFSFKLIKNKFSGTLIISKHPTIEDSIHVVHYNDFEKVIIYDSKLIKLVDLFPYIMEIGGEDLSLRIPLVINISLN